MKFINKLPIFLSALVLATSTYAAEEIICPSLDSIKAEMLTKSERAVDTLYVAFNISNYGQKDAWVFAIGPIDASSLEDALLQGNDVLANMTVSGVPRKDRGTIFCTYDTNQPNILSAAFKGLTFSSDLINKLLFLGPR